MPSPVPILSAKKLFHRGAVRIAFSFPCHQELTEKIKSLPGRKYSRTHRCWYLDYRKENGQAFLILGLPYTNDKPLENNTASGTVGPDCAPILNTATEEPPVSRPSGTSESRSASDTEILRTQAGKAYSPQSVQAVAKKAARKASISQKVTPHTLRHCVATHLHDSGISIKLIQELLGHKDIKTTMIYTHVSTSTVTSVKSPCDALVEKKANNS